MSWVFDDEVLAVVAAIVVVGFVFGFSQFMLGGRVVEPFSGLGILGPYMKIGDYPREVVVGLPFKLYLYVHNFEGKTVYYRILVKLGDRNSTISDVEPLDSNSIMEFRRVLTHNSTWIYPLNITLYEPGVNKRLVFEMWIYNETSKSFSYYGRWNQLWINITASPLNLTSTSRLIEIPSGIESLLIEGFLAVRRAEDSGGDIDLMVSLLNEALDYAQMGDYVKTEELIKSELSMEMEVSRMGLENRNRQLIFNVITLGIIFGGSGGSYLYFRRKIWIFWSKVKSKCIVKFSVRLNEIEDKLYRRIVEYAYLNRGITVEKLVSNSDKFRLRDYELSKVLFNMVKDGVIFLEDPNPPLKFHLYILSFYNLDFWITLTLLTLTIISIQFSQIPLIMYFRYILGSLFVLFLPGYSLIEALYPKQGDLTPLERLALSIGLSLALVPLVGLVLNYTPWGIRLTPIIVSLTLLTLTLIFISSWRKYSYLKLSFTAGGLGK